MKNCFKDWGQSTEQVVECFDWSQNLSTCKSSSSMGESSKFPELYKFKFWKLQDAYKNE